MKFNQRVLIRSTIIIVLLGSWFYWDITQAEDGWWPLYRTYKMADEFDAVTSATVKVAIVRSDDTELPNPLSVNDESIGYDEIESMVRRAIELAGGFEWIIKSGDMVLLKPNIVDPEPPGSGEVTDVRVIKSLIKIIDEISPGNIEIVVGEASPREMDYELPYSYRTEPRWNKLWDVAGYQDLLDDPYLNGINFRLSNLNGSPPENPWEDLVLVDVPGGGEASPQGGQYYVHKDILNANVFITVPVLKIHNPGVTIALKNQIGTAPSTIYGFSKTAGVSQNNYNRKLIHSSDMPRYWTDKEIVDLCSIAQIKFAVVDAIACLETKKAAIRNGNTITNLVRMNMIVAGADPVAVDHVCTRLMGLNPDDIEHITLAEMVGLGTNNSENINIVGAGLEETKRRFKKSQSTEGDFGQGNREWLMNGPFSIEGVGDPVEYEFIPNEAAINAVAAQNGWSEAVYFKDDRLDLKDYFGIGSGESVVSYAFSYFDAPESREAELWIGSDEALVVYINGEEIYRYTGTRSFGGDKFVSSKVNANIKEGENTLLVKSLQKYGNYDFCLNICEPESNPDFDGNRIWGLKFKTESNITSVNRQNDNSPNRYKIYNAYPNPFNGSVQLSYQLPEPDNVAVTIYNITGEKIRTMIDSEQQLAGRHSLYWNGLNDAGASVNAGVYFVNFRIGPSEQISQKIMYLK